MPSADTREKSHPETALPSLLVEVTGLAHGGSAAGRVAEGQWAGKRVFVRGAVPGERVQVQVVRDLGGAFEAELQQVLSSSSQRIAPSCPYFGVCGGCDLQYIQSGVQREHKRELVESTLRHHAGAVPEQGVQLIGADLPEFAYRRRAAFHVDEQGRIGFFKPKSTEVVAIERCLIAAPPLNAALELLRPWLQAHPGLVGGAVVEAHDERVFLVVKLRARPPRSAPLGAIFADLEKAFAGLTVLWNNQAVYQSSAEDAVPYGRFSQVNEAANRLLIETVVRETTGRQVTELYAGGGNFSLPLCAAGKAVEAIEVDGELAAHAEREAMRLDVAERFTVRRMSVETFLKRGELRESLVLDPPRSGARSAVERCRPGSPAEVVYVSCNPATLARDVKTLVAQGYRLEKVLVLDMFPQTEHIESVAVLRAA